MANCIALCRACDQDAHAQILGDCRIECGRSERNAVQAPAVVVARWGTNVPTGATGGPYTSGRVSSMSDFAKVCYHLRILDAVLKEPEAMNVSLTRELEQFIHGKVESGLYNNASEVIRESLRLLKEQDEARRAWREQIERGWQQAQAGQVVDGPHVLAALKSRVKARTKKRA